MLTTNRAARDESVPDGTGTVRVRLAATQPAEISLQAGGLLLDGLLGGGVPFAYACQAGICGQCRCQLVSGEVDQLPCSPRALEARDRVQGIILACRARVLSDLVIRAIPGPNAMDVEFDSPVAGALPCHVREGAGG
jgi:ferredoxin